MTIRVFGREGFVDGLLTGSWDWGFSVRDRHGGLHVFAKGGVRAVPCPMALPPGLGGL